MGDTLATAWRTSRTAAPACDAVDLALCRAADHSDVSPGSLSGSIVVFSGAVKLAVGSASLSKWGVPSCRFRVFTNPASKLGDAAGEEREKGGWWRRGCRSCRCAGPGMTPPLSGRCGRQAWATTSRAPVCLLELRSASASVKTRETHTGVRRKPLTGATHRARQQLLTAAPAHGQEPTATRAHSRAKLNHHEQGQEGA